MSNEVNAYSTPVMNNYIEFVFQKALELYKETVPDVLAKAFGIDIESVKNLSASNIKQMLDLTIRYEYVPENPRKLYRDNHLEYMLTKMAKGDSSPYTPKNNVLFMQTDERNVADAQSVEQLINMRETYQNNSQTISKLGSDIDYMIHELGHAFEHLINTSNPSYFYDFAMRDFQYNREERNVQNCFYNGEQFPISMEKIILEHLQENGVLEKHGLSQFLSPEDIKLVYETKRSNKPEITAIEPGVRLKYGSSPSGKSLTEEDIDTIFYSIYVKFGSKGLADFLANRDFVELRNRLPKNAQLLSASDDVVLITDFDTLDSFFHLMENPFQITSKSRQYPPIINPNDFQKEIIDLINPDSPNYNLGRAASLILPYFQKTYSQQKNKNKNSNDSNTSLDDGGR